MRKELEIIKVLSITAVICFAFPNQLYAQSLKDTVGSLLDLMKDVPKLMEVFALAFGGLMFLGGANKLKMHAENPQQTPMSHGLVRIGVGGLTAGMPFALNAVKATGAFGNNPLQYAPAGRVSELVDGFSGLWC